MPKGSTPYGYAYAAVMGALPRAEAIVALQGGTLRATLYSMKANLSYSDYARYAALDLDVIYQQCEAETFHASGPGGQGVNTSDSAVRMRHKPTGIVVVSRAERSQLLNRQACLRKIKAELLRRSKRPKRRKKTKPTKGSVRRRLESKHRRSDVKRLRRRPGMDE